MKNALLILSGLAISLVMAGQTIEPTDLPDPFCFNPAADPMFSIQFTCTDCPGNVLWSLECDLIGATDPCITDYLTIPDNTVNPVTVNEDDLTVAGDYHFGLKCQDLDNSREVTIWYTIHVHPATHTLYDVGGDGTHCAGDPQNHDITLSDSEDGVKYTLLRNSVSTGTELTGDGNSLTFPGIQQAGNYTIVADLGQCCVTNMTGSADINEVADPLQRTFTGGDYCDDPIGTGSTTLTLDDSEVGIEYWLVKNGTPVLGTQSTGDGNDILYNGQTNGAYYVEGANSACTIKVSLDLIIDDVQPPDAPDLDVNTTVVEVTNAEEGVNYLFYHNGSYIDNVTEDNSDGSVELDVGADCGIFRVNADNGICPPVPSAETTIPCPEPERYTRLMQVLDVSYSMGGDAGSGTESKLDVLKESVKKVADAWADWNAPDDILDFTGVISFNHNHTVHSLNTETWLGVTLDNINNHFNIVIDDLEHSGNTSLGGAIEAAVGIQQLDTDPQHYDHMVVFTDGIQTASPYVIETPTGPGPEDYTLTINGLELNTALGIPIYTIGVNSPSYDMTILKKIADKTGGTVVLGDNTNIYDLIDDALVNALVETLEDNSPQLIDIRKGVLTNWDTYASEKITIGGSINKIMFILSHDAGNTRDAPSFQILKDRINLTPYGTRIVRDNYTIIVFKYPLYPRYMAGRPFPKYSSSGTWEVRISGGTKINYKLHTIVDEKGLKYDCTTFTGRYRTGDAIRLKADLSFMGEPVESGVKIKATVLKPGEDIGTILSTYSVPGKKVERNVILAEDFEHIANMVEKKAHEYSAPADIKYAILMDNPKIRELLQSKVRTVVLEHREGGTYTGEFKNADVTGPYQIIFRISGSVPGKGSFHRYSHISTYRVFGDIDLSVSGFTHLPAVSAPQPLPDRFVFRPVDTFGNYLGPGHSGLINMTADNAKSTRVVDNLDGSYTILFADQEIGKKPEISVQFRGNEIYKGPVKKLHKPLPEDAMILKETLLLPESVIKQKKVIKK